MKTRVALLRIPMFLAVLVSTTVFTFAQEASNPNSAPKPATNADSALPPLSGTGAPNRITKWITSSTIGNSGIFENSAANVGIGTSTPATKFDVKGTGDFRDTLTLFPAGTHPTMSVSGTAFQIGSTGKVTFIAGQTFPGAGTVSTVNSGVGLTGGPIHATGTLSINTSVVPLLSAANIFTANQTVNGNLLVGNVFATGVTLNGGAATLMGAGNNPNAGQAGNPLAVSGGSAAIGATDQKGGDLILAAGDGTGLGGSGGVRIQAAAAGSSGTSVDTLVDRQVFAPKSASMGGQTGNAFMFLLNPANGDGAGATVRFTINANDGGLTNAAETGSCVISVSVTPGGTMESIGLRFGADSTDTGGVNAFCDIFNGTGNQVGISVGDNLTFVPTTHNIYFEIDNVSGSPLVVVAQTARVRRRLSQRVDATHPTIQVHRNR